MFSLYLKRTSVKTLLVIAIIYLVCKLYFLIFPEDFPIASQKMVFGWGMVAATLALGLLGYICTQKVGHAAIWQGNITNFQRFIIPALLGLVYGLITIAPRILYNDVSQHPQVQNNFTHVPFPGSIPFYVFGAIFMEIFLKLVCIGMLSWLISSLLLRGKYAETTFWIVTILVAFYEPMPYIQQSISAGKSPLLAIGAGMLSPLYISNVISGYIGKRFGFLASLTMRLAHYTVWHILFPLF
jgi:hypothetical protein